jgi:hypothetical protein
MATQQNPLIGYGGYTPEDLHAIVQRAHRERTQAMREFFAWAFSRRKATAEQPKQPDHLDAVACH